MNKIINSPYIQDIFSFYSSNDYFLGLVPSYQDLFGLIIITSLSFAFISKSFLINYSAKYSERFCFGWSIFSIYFFCLNNTLGISLLTLGYIYSLFLIFIWF